MSTALANMGAEIDARGKGVSIWMMVTARSEDETKFRGGEPTDGRRNQGGRVAPRG